MDSATVEAANTIWGPLPIGDTILCVCAWCNQCMGERAGMVNCRTGRITYGICPACAAAVNANAVTAISDRFVGKE